VHVAGLLDAPVRTAVETSSDRVLHAARGLSRDRALTQATRQRGDDLGHRQIGHEQVVPSLHHAVECVTAGLGQIELEQSAGVAVERAG